MKILLTVHQFFPQFASGTEVLTYSVATELIARGHDVRVLTAHPVKSLMLDEERFDEYQYEGIHIYRFSHSYTPMGGQLSMMELNFNNHLATDHFRKILEEFKPEVVHFFHLNRLGTGLIEQAVSYGIPAFMTPTDFWAICPMGHLALFDGSLCFGPNRNAGNCVKHFAENNRKGYIGRCIRRLPAVFVDWFASLTQAGIMPPYPHRIEVKSIASRLSINIGRLNQLNKIVSPNRFMTEKLVQYGVLPKLIVQSAYGVEGVHRVDATVLQRSSRQPFRVGYIGTLAPHKGCHVLIEAINTLPFGAAVLKIYGDIDDFPEYSNMLKQLVADHGNFEFCGTFHNSKIAEVLADLDVLVVPSLWFENTPLVLYSAQAACCPVVASNFPGISEVIRNEVNGLLFEPGRVDLLSTQLLRLINEPGLAERLSANAQQPKSTATYVDGLLSIWAIE